MRLVTASVLAQTVLTAGMTDAQIEQVLADLVGAAPQARGLDRRTFLQVIGLSAGAVAAGLWVPGQKTILLPPERSVVVATPSDLRALRAAFPGPFMIPGGWGLLDPTQAVRWLSDQEYRLVIARGHAILRHRR
jgi:hypothetical protein